MRTTTRLRRTAAAALITAVGLAAVTGCSGSGGSSGGTLTVQVESGQTAEMARFIAVFKKQNPGVTVKTTTLSPTAKTGSNLQVLTSSNAPDAALVPTNSEVYTKLTAGKQLVDLTDLWKSSNLDKRYGATLASSLKTDGKPYVVSIDSVIYNVVYYNKTLFQQAGIAEPADHRIASYDDLKGIVAKLKAAGKQGLSVGPTDNYQSSWLIDAALPTSASAPQLKGYLTSWQSASVPEGTPYTAGAFVNAVTQVQRMGADGIFQNGYLGQSVAQSEANFVQQKAGMLLDGSWTSAVLAKDKVSFPFGWLLLPPVTADGKTQVSLYSGNAYAIPVRAKNPELAKKFLTSMMTVQGQSTVPLNGSLPTVSDVPAAAFTSLPLTAQQLLADSKANGGQPGWTSVVPGGLGQQLVEPLVQQMLNGKGTPATIGAAVQAELTRDYRK